MMTRRYSHSFSLLAVLILLCLQGCGEASDVHEAGHVIPAHKPASFSDALEAIEQRQAELITTPQNETLRQELKDLINWLPELAAQTDLPKKDWDRIAQHSKNLSRELTHAEKQDQDWPLPAYWQELQTLARQAEAGSTLSVQKGN